MIEIVLVVGGFYVLLIVQILSKGIRRVRRKGEIHIINIEKSKWASWSNRDSCSHGQESHLIKAIH